MKTTLLALVALASASCGPANISAAKWNTGFKTDIQTRCEEVDMRNNEKMQALFGRYDGWKVLYLSEYTTPNRFGTDAVVCFQRGK